ncbi:hypothetical protein [Halalkalicoccus sp. NIPERK01]|uniref:hypothetical protein n=1 Tax=Halalkalicoccus sp. NIPERK01 TaxID=3053469 RepID=UPI00256EAE2E|nr:hypothetical protein [Halalkalicoccus sp. NIPERK01]MDL5360568.1 hypothetical protein [Halalkalicoccus sp. NIPERK01]
MPMKRGGEAGDARRIDRFEGGFGWIAFPDEEMQRASHALVSGGEVWLVDPVDTPDLDDWIAEEGDLAGVVVLLDRHTRDAAAIAARHGASVYVPEALADARREIDAPVETFSKTLPGTGYRAFTVLDTPLWTEVGLYDDENGTLVVAESVGTAGFFRAPGERLGVHPARRLFPPTALRGFVPERILVGHGEAVTDEAPEALREALSGSRRNTPRLYAKSLKTFLPL